MTLPPINLPPGPRDDDPGININEAQEIPWQDLERLAEKVIELMKRELRLDNEREGRNR